MDNYLDKSDEFRVEVRELELMMGHRRLGGQSDAHLDAGKQERQEHIRAEIAG